jgi:Protein of unknown function (DUF2752)
MLNVTCPRIEGGVPHSTTNIPHYVGSSHHDLRQFTAMDPTAPRLSTGDRIAVVIAAGAIVAAFVAAQIPRTTLATTPLCWSVILLHRECPGCGLTRSFAAIGRGSLLEANTLNPLGPILFAWAVGVIAIRIGKRIAPRFRYWPEMDMAFAVTAGLCIVTRTLLFYFG